MPTLKINFAGIELKNPLIVASSELTDDRGLVSEPFQ
jgi:dihydroorotate dehydrogenase